MLKPRYALHGVDVPCFCPLLLLLLLLLWGLFNVSFIVGVVSFQFHFAIDARNSIKYRPPIHYLLPYAILNSSRIEDPH